MADRTDIDALLIGALYGELTPADEARLTAHLESHPADRSALADLEHTRAAVHASGLRSVWLEPPQATSALLLQEAARRAGKPARAREDGERASWFLRLVRSLTAHPALAAAMTVIVVAGVASTLYVRRADKFGEASPADEERVAAVAPRADVMRPDLAQDGQDKGAANEATATAVAQAPAPSAAVAAGSGYADDLAAAAPAPAAPAEKRKAEIAQGMLATAPTPAPAPSKAAVAKRRAPQGITVEGRELAPKDLDEQSAGKLAKADRAPADRARDGDAAVATRAGDLAGPAGGGGAPGGPPAVAKPVAPTTPPEGFAAAPAAEPSADKAADTTVIGWAQRQHAQVVALVRANNCRAAASAAVEIYNRAPEFYASAVETDRAIKPCLAYVTSERERVDRARAAKRGSATGEQGSSAAGQPATNSSPATTPAPTPRR